MQQICQMRRSFNLRQLALYYLVAQNLSPLLVHRKYLKLSLLEVWMSHGDQVSQLPRLFKTIASTSNCPIAAMADEQRHFYGLQFHPEVSHTRQGKRIMEHFVLEICGCKSVWTPKNIIEEQ